MPMPVRPQTRHVDAAQEARLIAASTGHRQVAAHGTPAVWVSLLVISVIVAITTGRTQSMGLYLSPLTQSLGIGREPFGFALALTQLLLGFGAPIAGGLIDKHGAGPVVVLSTLAAIGGLLCLYSAQSTELLMAGGLLLGIGLSGAGVSALVGVAGRLVPPERRLAAMASVGMAASIGSLVALPIMHVLIELTGWRVSLLWLAAITALIIPLAWPIGGKPPRHPGEERGQTLREALKEALAHPSFVLLSIGYFVCGFQVFFVHTHLPAFALDQGLPRWVGPTALIVLGIANIAGTWAAGRLGWLLQMRQMLILLYLGRTAVFLAMLALPMSPAMLIGLSGLLGLIWLATIPLTSGLVATFFGTAWLSMLYGVVIFCHQIGAFLGVWLGGRIFDLTRSYDTMWWISAGLGLAAMILHWPIKERPVPRLTMPANAQPI